MLRKFLDFFKNHQISIPESKFLLAVSGGVDSMVLSNLCSEGKLKFDIAHCNFQLRGMESMDDEFFIKNHFENLGINVHVQRFETTAFAKKHTIGIQEAARKLRYNYFNKLLQANDYQYIITAHQANDNVETMLFNLSSGAGLRGIKGIAPLHSNLLRPLLFASKEDVLAYANLKKIPFREDSSNQSDKYTRNAFRLNVIPEIQKIKPNFIKSSTATLSHLNAQLNLFDFFIKNIEKNILSEENSIIKINLLKLKEYPETSTILHELLHKYQFSSAQAGEISKALHLGHSGKYWHSSSHEILLDRAFLILREKKELIDFEILITNENQTFETNGLKISTEIIDTFDKNQQFDKNTIFLDVTKCTFPLNLRKWQAGDFFLPLGMEGRKKKIQDFLTNLKLTRFEKNEVLVLESNQQIAWVVNHRADTRFLANTESSKILKINILQLA
jgi:tRNA(Ile)-lysidine synthase